MTSILFAAVKCQLRGVPDNLRHSLSRVTVSMAGSMETKGEEEEGVESEHPYDIITRLQLDLEPYVLLLQVSVKVLWNV